jgi:hypothetical protein
LAGEQADLDLGLIEPTAVFRRLVNGETVPQFGPLLDAKVIQESLGAVDIQVIHDEVDRMSGGIAGDYDFQSLSELRRGPVWVTSVKCFPAFGSTAQNTLAVPHRLYSLSGRLGLPGAMGLAGLTSSCSVTGFSSRQTTGSAGL